MYSVQSTETGEPSWGLGMAWGLALELRPFLDIVATPRP